MKQVEITSKIIGRGGSTTSASPSLDLSGYALISDLLNYVTISGNEDVTGLHDFVNGLKVGGLPITKKQDDVVYLDANLVVRGGITMYGDGEGGSSVPSYSTLGSLLNVDESNDAVASVDRVLFQSAGSNVWSWKPLSEIGGGSSGGGSVSGDYLPLSGGTISGDLTMNNSYGGLRFINTSNNNLGFLGYSGGSAWYLTDNYWKTSFSILHTGNYSSYALPLSGGTINGAGDYLYVPLFINALNNQISGITFQTNGTERGHVGYHYELGMRLHTASTAGIAVSNSDVPIFYTEDGAVKNTILHSGNYSSYALPLSGGTINGSGSYSAIPLVIKNSNSHFNGLSIYANTTERVHLGYWSSLGGVRLENVACSAGLSILNDKTPSYYKINSDGTIVKDAILHAGNYSSYALPLSGGTMTGNLTLQNEKYLYVKDTSGVSRIGFHMSGGNNLHIANGTATAGYNTYINGANMYFESYNGSFSTSMFIKSNGNVGIGTTSPSEKLQVEGNCWLKNGRLSALYAAFDDMYSITDRVNYNAVRIGTFDRTEGGFVIQLGKHNVNNTAWRQEFSIIDSGWTTTLFSVNRSGNVLANGGITMYSDIRKKTKLQDVELSLSQIANAPLIEHYYNSDQEKTTHVGSIAQYWAGINDWFCKLDNEGFYTMEIQNCALASAISIARHLEKYESKTDKKIRMLKKRIQELEDKVERLKKGA